MSCSVSQVGGAAARRLIVLKFGSSVLSEPARFGAAAREVRREIGAGTRAVVVVSAMGQGTEQLLSAARAACPDPPGALLGALLSTGEEASVALMTMALGAVEVDATALSTSDLALKTAGPVDDADPIDFDMDRVESLLGLHDAIVVPGFVGRDGLGAPSLLGRGGSDLTALFIGHALAAERIRLVKDVAGVYASDPNSGDAGPPLPRVTWREAEEIGGGVVQGKALRFAAGRGVGFWVGGMETEAGGGGTWVGPGGIS